MLYDSRKDIDVSKAQVKLQSLIDKGAVIELKEKRRKRTIRQNSYLHVCISLFAIEYGYTLDEAKTLLKRMCPFMVYEKNGQKFLKKTSKQDTKEQSEFVEWIRNYAGMNGLHIPSPQQYIDNQIEIDKQIEQHKNYL